MLTVCVGSASGVLFDIDDVVLQAFLIVVLTVFAVVMLMLL